MAIGSDIFDRKLAVYPVYVQCLFEIDPKFVEGINNIN